MGKTQHTHEKSKKKFNQIYSAQDNQALRLQRNVFLTSDYSLYPVRLTKIVPAIGI